MFGVFAINEINEIAIEGSNPPIPALCATLPIDIFNKPFETVRQKESASQSWEHRNTIFVVKIWLCVVENTIGAGDDYGEEEVVFDFSMWCLKHKKPML